MLCMRMPHIFILASHKSEPCIPPWPLYPLCMQDGNVRSSASHRSPDFASERVAWVDPSTFWENVRRNGEELNRRDALEAPSDTNAQVRAPWAM